MFSIIIFDTFPTEIIDLIESFLSEQELYFLDCAREINWYMKLKYLK